MGLLSSLFGKKDKGEAKRGASPKPDFGNVSAGASSTARKVSEPAPAPASAPRTGSAVAAGTTYEIKKGDSLSAIAQRFYGDAGKWRTLYDANRDTIDDPDKIYPGQKITIPNA